MTTADPIVARRVELALAAHARGWVLTPLHGKEAYLPAWQKRPPPTRDDVAVWAAAGNVGIRTGRVSGVVLVDVDVHRGGSIPPWAASAPRVRTGRGGAHCYFAAPIEPVPNSKDAVAPGVEILADGKQAVYAGGVHPDTGVVYAWDVEPGAELPALPEDVAAALRQRKAAKGRAPQLRLLPPDRHGSNAYGRRAVELELARVRQAPEGRRNDELNAAAFSLGQLHAGGELEDVQDDLLAAALEAGLPQGEAEKTIRSGWIAGAKEPRTAPPRPAREGSPPAGRASALGSGAESDVLCTDLGNARRIVRVFGKDLRWTAATGWLVWDGARWAPDQTQEAQRRAKTALERIFDEAKAAASAGREIEAEQLAKWALRSQSAEKLAAALRVAESEPGVATLADTFDRDPWLLNVRNGTLDLRTGVLREHSREDYLTKLAPIAFDAEATCPRWVRFLADVQPDPEVRVFLARYAGYCLTGTMGEQVFAIHHGGGENGKGVYSDTLLAILGLGEYAKVTPYDTFLVRRQGAATNDLAALRGTRLVVASEPNEGVRLDEGAVKAITGEDPITARFHYREFFTFRPTCKLILTGNHRPRIRGTDHAMWRRVRLVPWPVTVPAERRDNDLKIKLRDELPGVLAWAVRGCLDWQREGLRPPSVVLAAAAEYREAEDHVGLFLADRCRLGSELAVSSKDLRAAYEAWAEEEGEEPLSSRALGGKLVDRGIRPIRNTDGVRGRGWKGIAVGTLGTDGRFGEEGPLSTPHVGDLSEESVQASYVSQQNLALPVEAAEFEAVREQGDGRARGPLCPICARTDRPAGGADGCRVCREFLEATGGGREGDPTPTQDWGMS